MAEIAPAAKQFFVDRSVLLPNLIAGLVVGLTEVVLAISFASLIFSGPLRPYLAQGIAITLTGAVVGVTFCAIFSSFVGGISSVQDNPAVLMAIATASIAAALGTSPQLVPTVIFFILTTTLLTGTVLALLGYFRLGGLVRYIPYPVIGGFLAGTGWLLAQGSIGVMADFPLSFATIPELLQPDQLVRWLPGVIFGSGLFFAIRYIKHFFVLPGMLLGGFVAYYAFLILSGTSVNQAMQDGLLLGAIAHDVVWQPPSLESLSQVDWSMVLAQAGSIATIIVITTIASLLNVSGLEIAFHKDVNLNSELRTVGFSNILSAVAGGMINYHSVSLTMLNHSSGGRGRAAGVIAGLICLVMLIFGMEILAYIPKAVLGGLILLLGLLFLDEWALQGYKKFGLIDYGVVLLILFIIATSGFLTGVGVGLMLMVLIFVLNYSRVNIFHHTLSGSEAASHVVRSCYYQRALTDLGKHIYVIELQGFIFFGSANAVLEHIYKRLNSPDEKSLAYLILDFRRVTGLDSSALLSLTKVRYLADLHNFVLVFTNLTEDTQQKLARNGLAADEKVKFFPDLDHGLEWCEDELLDRHQITRMHIPATLQLQLADAGFKKDYTAQLKPYLDKKILEEGEYLIRQGEASSDLFFIEVGQVSVYLELENGKKMRVQTMGMGTVVGELSFYLNTQRSASVIADMKSIVYGFTRQGMEEMKTQNPELAVAFHELMVRLVAERLVMTDGKLAALNR